MLLIAVGAYGWGSSLVTLLTRSTKLSARPVRLDPALDVAIGIALFLAIGGYFVAANLAYIWFLVGWQIIGVFLAIFQIVRTHSFLSWGQFIRTRLLLAWAGIGALCFFAIGPALSGTWNINDDGPAYTYLGQRLLATGGLIDPFNTRRLNSYGGAELFQGIVIRTVGVASGLGIEWFLFLLLSVALFIRTIRRPWATWAIWTVGLFTVIMRPVGIWANVAPTLSGTALTLAIARIVTEHRDEDNLRWVYLLSGLLFAGLFALRLEFVFAGAAVIIVSTLVARHRRRSPEFLLLSGLTVAFGLIGWAIALERSSGSFLFPMQQSYWTQQSWFKNPQVRTLGQHLREVGTIANGSYLDIGLLGSLVIAIVLFVFLRRSRSKVSPAGVAVDGIVALVLGTFGLIVSQAYTNSGSTTADLARYIGPSALACVLFALMQLWNLVETTAPSVRGSQYSRRQKAVSIMLLIFGVGFFFGYLGPHPQTLRAYITSAFRESFRTVAGEPVLKDNWNSEFQKGQLRTYEKINARIPVGSHLLAAVSLPGDLDFAKFSFTTLDEPGGSSPPPHLQLNGSVDQVVAYLRSQGIDGIVASVDSVYGLYNLPVAQSQLQSIIPAYRAASQDTIAWDKLLVKIAHRYRTVRVPHLRYISFDALARHAPVAKG
jgi:hypothetical protein